MTSPLQQKIKITGPNIVTANRLGDGAVVYRTARRRVDDGNCEAGDRLDRAGRDRTSRAVEGRRHHAVDVYLAPVKLERRQHSPGNLREMIRMRGPTIDLPITFGI